MHICRHGNGRQRDRNRRDQITDTHKKDDAVVRLEVARPSDEIDNKGGRERGNHTGCDCHVLCTPAEEEIDRQSLLLLRLNRLVSHSEIL
mmetsp:Transcript_13697/g.16659  ORF Transcript_13697/g.16659 Transcript_13697/m.16659 type:complete len:90 (+) Transcript_13697:1451-1720(+)